MRTTIRITVLLKKTVEEIVDQEALRTVENQSPKIDQDLGIGQVQKIEDLIQEIERERAKRGRDLTAEEALQVAETADAEERRTKEARDPAEDHIVIVQTHLHLPQTIKVIQVHISTQVYRCSKSTFQ